MTRPPKSQTVPARRRTPAGNWRLIWVLYIAAALLMTCLFPAYAQQPTSQTDPRLATLLKRFPKADIDGDGVLTRQEVQEYRKRWRAERRKRESAIPALKPTLANVAYGTHPRQVLDVFKAEATAPTPVLIFFHGGGFVAGDKIKGARHTLSKQCLKEGISVVSANYRYVRKGRDGAPAAPFPGPMEDGARVVQFVRSKAAEWNIDPTRIALTGGSAGACMSIWIALHDDMADPDGPDPVSRLSTRVSAVVGYNGPTTLDPKVILKHVGGNPDIHPSLKPFYDVESVADLESPEKRKLVEQASALNFVSPDDPPLYLSHGGDLASAPLPADASFGKSIHHPMFGKLLQDAYAKHGLACHLQCRDKEAPMDPLTFLKQVFAAQKN